MAKKDKKSQVEVETQEEPKTKGIKKLAGKDGEGVTQTIANVLKKSKAKGGLTHDKLITMVGKNFDGADKGQTIRAQLGTKNPMRLELTTGIHVEIKVIQDKPIVRSYKYAGDVSEEQMAEWKADIKAAKAAKKAEKDTPPELEDEDVREIGLIDDAPDSLEMEVPLTKAEKKALKKAKKAAKKAKKLAEAA